MAFFVEEGGAQIGPRVTKTEFCDRVRKRLAFRNARHLPNEVAIDGRFVIKPHHVIRAVVAHLPSNS